MSIRKQSCLKYFATCLFCVELLGASVISAFQEKEAAILSASSHYSTYAIVVLAWFIEEKTEEEAEVHFTEWLSGESHLNRQWATLSLISAMMPLTATSLRFGTYPPLYQQNCSLLI